MAGLGLWPDLRLRTKGLVVIAVPAAATVLIACASYLLGARADAAASQRTRISRTAASRSFRTAAFGHVGSARTVRRIYPAP